jgi:hypothetical protein
MNYEKIKISLETYIKKISEGVFNSVSIDLSYHKCCSCNEDHLGLKINVDVDYSKIEKVDEYRFYEWYFEDKYYKDIKMFFNLLSPKSKFFFRFNIINKFTEGSVLSPLVSNTTLLETFSIHED